MFSMISRNDPCFCGSGKKWKKCHYPLKEHPQKGLADEYFKKYGIILKNDEQLAGIRRSCQLAAYILKKTCEMAKAGVPTNEINDFSHQLHIEANAIPAPLGYGSPPYPKSICTSLNHEICHGIPNDIPLKEGDILNIDVSCILDGFFGDCSAMVTIGKITPEKENVVNVAQQCLMRAIAILRPGLILCEIGDVIEDYAIEHGCSVVNQFVGHGVGLQFHEPPQVPHHRNETQIPLAPGMTFTIEPMINAGVRDGYIDSENHWTAYTKDGKPSAQWEHTLLVTDSGCEILTLLED
ncbi:MAG: Methionine aminopeptidase [Chlamydiae bacterium]|nr:Methionine aminopeptidase [Chlamydiota bacterium]